MTELVRKCKKCGKTRPLDEFPSYGKGRRHECVDCNRERLAQWHWNRKHGIEKPKPDGSVRTCKVCGETKPIEEFAPIYIKGKNYRQHTCIPCYRVIHAERQRRARALNPKKYRAIQKKCNTKHRKEYNATKRKRKQERKDEVFAAYGGYRCVCCGETEPTMLNIDHVDNNGSEHRKSITGDMYDWLINNGFPEGFQVLCYNCNLSKHRNGGVCAHQLNKV